MSDVTVKEFPEKLLRQLKLRALQHHRSLSSEIIALLEFPIVPSKLDPDAILARAASLRQEVSGRLTDSDLAPSHDSRRR